MLPFYYQSSQKKRQLRLLVGVSVGLIVFGWIMWIIKFGFSTGLAEDASLFSNWQKSSQTVSDELKIFKDKLQNSMTGFEKIVIQEKAKQDMIERLKQEIVFKSASSTEVTTVIVTSSASATNIE
jgi:hypothetical protein